MRNKQTNKSTTPQPGQSQSPSQRTRQSSQSHNQKYYRDILIKFTPKEFDGNIKPFSQEQVFVKDQQIEVEDIADDSDEERSIKHLNMFQIKSLEAGGGAKGVFAKNFSEHDFLLKEQAKENGIRLFKDFHQIHFKFDNILIPKDSQEAVFSKVQSIVQSFLMGSNGTIFAYGQTGAGKTYSIMGGEERGFELMPSQRRGILPRTLDQVFYKGNQQGSKFFVSFFEIYNEKIFDLLNYDKQQLQNTSSKRSQSKNNNSQKIPKNTLEIREEKDGYFSIPDLKKYEVKSLEEAYQYLDKGLLKRQTSSTSLNNKSSRSHSIFQIYLEKETENGIILKSKIRIVDLAGSEKYTIKKDLPQVEKNQKVQELTSINSSLSALGQCISALSDPSRKHIPYRNSKLTKVLKDSLDENSLVALIICISPSTDSYKETLSTLQFADRAKKAILDGRNFSDSKLLQNHTPNTESLTNIMKAYQEEKAIRKGLELYMRENNQFEVFEELERLKKQNKELQDKVRMLEQNSSQPQQEKNNLPNQLRSCIKRPLQENTSTANLININIIPTRIKEVKSPNSAASDKSPKEDSNKKRVRFATKLENDDSLDSDMRERIEHNLKYNDDTIFDNISIFRDVNNSGLFHPKLVKEKHPSKMKEQFPIEDDEDEEEEKKESNSLEEKENEQQIPILISNLEDENLKEFWAIPIQGKKQRIQNKENCSNENGTVSPISSKKINNSSQDLSKDLIDLNNDQALKKFQDESDVGRRIGDKTMGRKNVRNGNQQQYIQDQQKEQEVFETKQASPFFQQQNEQEEDSSDDHDNPKDYHVCDTSEQFFEADFANTPKADFGNDQLLTDSIMAIEQQNDVEQNNSQDNQNTLILDSQSIIIEGDNNNARDANLSQQMQSLEASSIIQGRDGLNHQMQNAGNPHYNHQVNQHFFFSMGGIQSQSQANSSNINTDVLTYSLTNTFSTIESLHDELAAIRNGVELSQKRGASILKVIHKYAKEIEENKVIDMYSTNQLQIEDYKEEESKEQLLIKIEEDENIEGSSILERDISHLEEENLNFIKDIQGFYSKIHTEIAQLKSILMDSAKNSNSPLLSRKHTISERVPQKPMPQQVNIETPKNNRQNINLEYIDKSQEIIQELRKQMEVILNNSESKKQNKAQRSLRVLDLLEILQNQLAMAVTPTKKSMTSINKQDHQLQISNQQSIKSQKEEIKNDTYGQFLQKQSTIHSPYSTSNKKQVSAFQQIADGRNIIQYEELPSENQSPQKFSTNNKSSPNQRTPEIFKSLAKLDDSEANSSAIPFDRDILFSQSQQTNYQITNNNIFFSSQQQQQDFQITLRNNSNNQNDNIIGSQIQQQQYDAHNNIVTEKKRVSAVDNTLTLIFDSDEEEENNLKEQVEECDNSPIFNDVEDSQIEGGSQGVNITHGNLITSNSFQADNSLLFFANNFIMGGENNQQELLPKQRNLSFNGKEQVLSDITPERDTNQKSKFLEKHEKKTNKKYLLPQLAKESPDQIQLINPKFTQKEANFDPGLSSDDISTINKSTSKRSVHKYWNQFFNNANKSMKSNATPEHFVLNNNQLNIPSANQQLSRNQQQYISRSAYQSNSFKEM